MFSRIIAYFIVFSFAASAFLSVAAYAQIPADSLQSLYQVDPNGDGTLNVADLLDVLQALGENTPNKVNADLDNNSALNIFDLLELLNLLTQKPQDDQSLIITRFVDPESAGGSQAVQLATSIDEPDYVGVFDDSLVSHSARPVASLDFFPYSDRNGKKIWGNKRNIKVDIPIIVLACRYIDEVPNVYASRVGISDYFLPKAGEIYLPEIVGLENELNIEPQIIMGENNIRYIVWETLFATRDHHFFYQTPDLSKDYGFQALVVYTNSVELFGNGLIDVAIYIAPDIGLVRGKTSKFIYRSATGSLEPFEPPSD